MPDITATLSARAYDGLVAAGAKNAMATTALAADVLEKSGLQYANLLGIGVLTSGKIISRLTPDEYSGILQASQTDPDIKALVDELISEGHIAADDKRLTQGFAKVVAAGLLAPGRPTELLAYEHPTAP